MNAFAPETTMKICIATIALAISMPQARGQSDAPSAAPSSSSATFVPTSANSDVSFQSLAPSIDPSCPEACVGLEDPCCPTEDGIFLDCCFGITASPTTAQAPAPSPLPTRGILTPAPTLGVLAPSPITTTPSASTPQDSSSMPSTEGGIVTSMPTDSDGTPIPTPLPSIAPAPAAVTLTPKNYNGCIKVNGNGDEDDDFRLASCNKTDPKQQLKFVGDQIQLEMDSTKCLQGGRNPMPEGGKYLRVFKCDPTETLQRFSWDAPDGALTLLEFPNLAVVFRGTTANVNTDPIILGDLNESEVVTRKDWVILP